MIVLITLTTAGSGTGPFNLYSDVNGFAIPFQTGVSKSTLVAGYYDTTVPDGTTIIRVVSTGTCNTQVELPVSGLPGTTTTTTTAPIGTTTTTTTAIPTGNINISYNTFSSAFTIYSDVPVPQSVFISAATSITGYSINSCTFSNAIASAQLTGSLLGLLVGNTIATHAPTATSGSWGMGSPYQFDTLTIPLSINGGSTMAYANNATVMIGGTLFTIHISKTCL